MPKTSSLPFGRLLGEFFVIVIGVLVALAVDAWRDGQAESRLADDHLLNLVADLTVDSAMLATMGDELIEKREALGVLREVALGETEIPADSVAALLFPSAVYGWRIPAAQNAAYEALNSTGGLRLISNSDLRSEIVLYYEGYEHQLDRLDRHRSSYPNAVYRLLPPEALFGRESVGFETRDLVSRIRTTEMRDNLNHEANYSSTLANQQAAFQARATDLLRDLRAELR